MSHRGEHVIQREILRHYIALAAKVGAPYIRTFGDGVPEDDAERRNKVLGLAAESYAAVDDWAGEHGVTVLLETHTNMYGEWARQILDDAQADNLGILWHIGHHLRRGKSVAETYPHIRGHVRHLHFQAPESRPESTPDEGKDQAGHLVFPSSNEGRVVTDADNQETFDLLAEDGFQGFFSVEYINPENPDEILERHARKFQEYMSNIE
jgi:sugar phosphate isomerase/epimerase